MSPAFEALPRLLGLPHVARAFEALDGDGEEVRIVGGAVRNALLGLRSEDIDLATTAIPSVTMRRARHAGLVTVPTGLAHGTVTVLVDGRSFEVTTLRRDVETDGRHARVVFGRDFDADARRRDFTMNALSLGRDGRLRDPVGGLPDLEAGRVRFIGDARARIAEDYLRILRLFRFHAAYGRGALDIEARDAAVAERRGLARLSAERISGELMKLLVAARAAEVLSDMDGLGLLTLLLAGMAHPARLRRAVEIGDALGAPPEPAPRLAALALAVREDAERLRNRLRLSNAVTRRLREVAQLVEADHGMRAPTLHHVDALLFGAPREAVRDALLVLHAKSGAGVEDEGWRAAHGHAANAPKPSLPVTGDDLLQRGVPAGRRVGAVLKSLQARWIRAGFPRDPATVGRLIEDAIIAAAKE